MFLWCGKERGTNIPRISGDNTRQEAFLCTLRKLELHRTKSAGHEERITGWKNLVDRHFRFCITEVI